MKPELQRIRIAKACGFDESHWLELGGGIVFGTSGSLPDYPNDLNAMHEAEKVLKGGLRNTYDAWLGIIAKQEHCFIWETTAAQRSEAFLRTLNLWEE
jgi:hypothetical protein